MSRIEVPREELFLVISFLYLQNAYCLLFNVCYQMQRIKIAIDKC